MLFSWWFVRRLACLVVASVLFAGVLGVVLASAITDDKVPAWVSPNAMAIRRVGTLPSAQSEPHLLNNLDCTSITYRLTGTSTMQSGCFTETALGLLDSSSGTLIFNGTDEGIQLLSYGTGEVLAPWPKAGVLLALDTVNTGGTTIRLYKNPLAVMQDQRNALGQLTAKQLIAPPDITLKNILGKPLVINPQTLAFSDDGSWLVAEVLGSSFVRVNLATLDITAFAPAYAAQGNPALLNSRVAISDDGRFVAIVSNYAPEFKLYDLTNCGAPVTADPLPQSCHSYDYLPFSRQQIGSLPFVGHVHFLNEGLLSFNVGGSINGVYELAPGASIISLTDYIGLGDSFTSGEGAFNYLNGTDTGDNMCHLSRNSYPLLLTHDVFSARGGHSVACSGAVINDVGNTGGNYRGQVRGVASLQQLQQSAPLQLETIESNFMPGYVAQQRFVKRWQPQVVTVSIGGNDIGFGALLQNCVEAHVSRHLSGNTCYNTYEDRLELMRLADRTIPRWRALYNQLQREAPGTQLYAIGYPQIALPGGNCAVNVQLNKAELEFAANMIDYLNHDIQQAAAAAGVPYVDISQALVGHRLCEAAGYDVAVNGLTAGTDAGILGAKFFGKESYHPNTMGQALIEQAILQQTNNLHHGSSDSDTVVRDLLTAPKSGRTINTLVPENNLAGETVDRGAALAVHAVGSDDGIRPLTTYTVRLDGSGGGAISTVTSDDNGDMNSNVTIPITTATGGHRLDITGTNQSGEPVDITQPIYITSGNGDSDGDDIPDSLDSCPGASNSGQDSDKDGVDDICDSLPTMPGNGAGPPFSNLGLGSTASLQKILEKDEKSIIATAAGVNSGSGPPATGGNNPRHKQSAPAKVLGYATGRLSSKTAAVFHRTPWVTYTFLSAGLGFAVIAGEKYTQKPRFRLQ